MHVIAYASAAAVYLALSVRYGLWFARARPGTPRHVGVLVAGGAGLHVLGLVLYWIRFGEPPLVGLGPSLATLALLVVLALAGLAWFSSARALGLLLAPVATLLLALGLVVGLEPATGSAAIFRGPWLAFHISLSFVGYAGWLVAAAAGSMYLLQFREIKHRHLGAIFQFFPPLGTLDDLSRTALVVGFASLTMGILLGTAWTLRFEPGLGWRDAKVLWGVLSWLVLAVVVRMRFSGQRTGRQAAVWNVSGFGLVFMAYVLIKVAAPGTRFFL